MAVTSVDLQVRAAAHGCAWPCVSIDAGVELITGYRCSNSGPFFALFFLDDPLSATFGSDVIHSNVAMVLTHPFCVRWALEIGTASQNCVFHCTAWGFPTHKITSMSFYGATRWGAW